MAKRGPKPDWEMVRKVHIYSKKGLSLREIARLIEKPLKSVFRWKHYDYPTDAISAGFILPPKYKPTYRPNVNDPRRKVILAKLAEGKTYKKIGKEMNLSRQRIHQIATGYHSPEPPPKVSRAQRVTFRKSGKWIDSAGLTTKFQGRELVREAIRRRDNYQCQHCRRIWKEGERRFDVHHLEGCGIKSRKYDKVSETDGLITLCHKCHLNLETVRAKMRQATVDKQKIRAGFSFKIGSVAKP